MEDTEILQGLEKIRAQVKEPIDTLRTELRELKMDFRAVEQRVLSKQPDSSVYYGRNADSIGALVAKQFEQNQDAFKRHKTLSLEISTKSISSSLVGMRSSTSPTPGGDVQVITQLLPKLSMVSAGGAASLVYGRRSVGVTGTGAAAVGENVSRPKSEPIYVSTTQPLCTVAGYAELSETALRTTGELQSVVDLHLQADVFRAADVLLLSGGTNFTGGMLALATADVLPFVGTNDLLEEHIAIEAMSMRALGYQPNIVVVNPLDWRAVYLRREVGGLYVHGSPLEQAPLLIAGCQVVFNTAVTTKTALVLDSRYVDFMPNEAMRIELAYVASQFLTGEITVRAELQGLPVVRDLGAIKLVSRAAS